MAYEVEEMDAVEVACDIAYKQLDDAVLKLDLYLPAETQPADRLPAVVLVHGNDALSDPLRPIDQNWKSDMFTHGLVVGATGMAAIAPAYRGYRASGAESVAAAQQDLLDLLTYLEENADDLMVDPERVCIWTTSGGGLPGAWAALLGDPQPRCAVIFSGRLSIPSTEVSPEEQVSSDSPPFFIAGGKFDGYHQVSTFVERSTAAGADVTVREHPDGRAAHFEQTADPASAAIIAEALVFITDRLAR